MATRIELDRRFDVSLRDGFHYITDPSNWAQYWPGLVALDAGSRWREPGDRARLTLRLLGRRTELRMTLVRLEPYHLVEYTSVQAGLPDARHLRYFVDAGNAGFDYRLAVELEPRPGIRGAFDRTVARAGTARAMRQTLRNLERGGFGEVANSG